MALIFGRSRWPLSRWRAGGRALEDPFTVLHQTAVVNGILAVRSRLLHRFAAARRISAHPLANNVVHRSAGTARNCDAYGAEGGRPGAVLGIRLIHIYSSCRVVASVWAFVASFISVIGPSMASIGTMFQAGNLSPCMSNVIRFAESRHMETTRPR